MMMKNTIKETFTKSLTFDDVSIINKNIKKIAKQLGYGDAKYIGEGTFGMAYDVGDDKILKITNDVSEAGNANKLRRKPITKHIINYYDVRVVRIGDEKYYSIVMDKVQPITDRNNKLFYNDIYSDYLNPTISDKDMLKFVLDYLEGYETEDFRFYREKLEPQRQSVLKEFKKYGIPTGEAHVGNVGFDDEGNFVYFDIGVKPMRGKIGKILKPMTMKEELNIKKHIPKSRECKKCGKKTKQTHKETEKLHIYKCAQCNNVEWDKKNKKDMKTIKLTESDLTNMVKKIVNEASNVRIMRTVKPDPKEFGKYDSLDTKRKMLVQKVIDRILDAEQKGTDYVEELKQLNSKYPSNRSTFGQY